MSTRRRDGHVCYCEVVDGKMQRVDEPTRDSFEFFVSDRGDLLSRVGVSGTEDPVVCATSAWQIADFCDRKKCRVPEATARRLVESIAVADKGGETVASKGKRMKNDKGQSVNQVWEELFVENEKRKDKWTDEQLSEEIKSRVPKLKTSKPRPAMYRAFYNNGTYTFKGLGPAKDRGLPESFKYDANGNKVLPGRRGPQVDGEKDKKSSDKISIAEHQRRQKKSGKGQKKVIRKKRK